MKYLYTYGTLMNLRCRNYILRYFGFQYKGNAKLSGYSILHYPRGEFPVILPASNTDCVTGELWEFPDFDSDTIGQILGALDLIEDEGHLYKREIVSLDNSRNAIAYVGIPDVWKDVALTKAALDESGKWIGGEYIA